MIPYTAPTDDMRFVLNELGLLDQLQSLQGCDEVSADLVDAVLEEAGKLASDILAPINYSGDKERAQIENGVVRTPEGFKEAYRAYVEGGWNSVPFEEEHGGQGLPMAVSAAIQEMWQSANMAWALCPLLNQGAVEALQVHGDADQKTRYLPKMVSGEWSGTMNLTEPQAGSDLALIKTRATRAGDGSYRIKGMKIFITYGEHDMAENIVHLVLARLDDAPAGTRGISLFLVPKFLLDENGNPGQRNDLRCVSIEHKTGIMGSPTCVMAYGDNEGAVGYLIGEENRGLECMFTMMNNARLGVAQQGLSLIERAYQQARDYAKDRKQGKDGTGQTAAIVKHADVRRMLMTMRSTAEAMRALLLEVMTALDVSHRHDDPDARAVAKRRVDLMTPVLKGWFTEASVELTSLGVQVHGGMGFIEETGAAQHFRDSRILPIYEGTTGIQGADLVGRKLIRDGGAAAREYHEEMNALLGGLSESDHPDVQAIANTLSEACEVWDEATGWLLAEGSKDPDIAGAASTTYLKIFGLLAGGTASARGAAAAAASLKSEGPMGPNFYKAKIATARFFSDAIVSQTAGLLPALKTTHIALRAVPDDLL